MSMTSRLTGRAKIYADVVRASTEAVASRALRGATRDAFYSKGSEGAASRDGAEKRQRVVIVQYGDYLEAVQRLDRGERSNYYGQSYTVGFVRRLARDRDIHVVCLNATYQTTEATAGIQCSGLDITGGAFTETDIIDKVRALAPTHLVVHAPLAGLIAWATRSNVEVLPFFADSFRAKSPKARLQARLLAGVLSHPKVPFVTNHALAAARDLVRLGVPAQKVVPWDWPAMVDVESHPVKPAPKDGELAHLIYVGQVSQAKGVFDLVRAMAELRQRGRRIRLHLIGSGDIEALMTEAKRLGVLADLRWHGRVSHDEVIARLTSSHAAIVPSRHEYPEGKPMTLFEALSTRTPLICSDHPMFELSVEHGETAMVFEAGNAVDLADNVEKALFEPGMYDKLTVGAGEAAKRFFCPVKWHAVLDAWLDPQRRHLLARHSVSADPNATAPAHDLVRGLRKLGARPIGTRRKTSDKGGRLPGQRPAAVRVA